MRQFERILLTGLAVSLATVVQADTPPPPPDGWSGKGGIGFLDASGNLSTESVNANLLVSDLVDGGLWKHTFNADWLQAKTNSLTTANRYDLGWQSNYNFTSLDYLYGNLTYISDKFSGFAYQANATVGYGRKIIFTDETKLTAQIGVGYGEFESQTPVKAPDGALVNDITGSKQGSAVVQGQVHFEQVLTASTKVLDDLKVTYSNINTYIQNDLGLSVKVSTALALTVGYEIKHNSVTAAGVKPTDSLTSLNLVYSF